MMDIMPNGFQPHLFEISPADSWNSDGTSRTMRKAAVPRPTSTSPRPNAEVEDTAPDSAPLRSPFTIRPLGDPDRLTAPVPVVKVVWVAPTSAWRDQRGEKPHGTGRPGEGRTCSVQ